MAKVIQSKPFIEHKRRSLVQKACIEIGVAFIAVGIFGFIVQNLQGMMDQKYFSHVHDLMRFTFGALALGFGMADKSIVADRFALWMGAFLGLFGIVGLIFGHRAYDPMFASLPMFGTDPFMIRVSASLSFGTIDHVLHLISGAFLLMARLPWRRKVRLA